MTDNKKWYADPLLDALSDIDYEIEELRKKKEALSQIDFDRPPSEEEWHIICSSSLRYSKKLGTLLKLIFPNAEQIIIGANYASLRLYDFDVRVPTTLERGVMVDTSWYRSKKRVKSEHEYLSECAPYEFKQKCRYFRALDSGESWKKLAAIRISAPKWTHPFLWFGWFRWHSWNRAEWEQSNMEWHEKWKRYRTKTNQDNAEVSAKVELMEEKLLPELLAWTDNVHGIGGILERHLDPKMIVEKEHSLCTDC